MASCCWILIFFALTVNSAFSAKIAGLSAIGEGSHYFVIRNTMEELAARGHEVALVVPSDVRLKSNEKLPHMVYKVPYEPGFSEELFVKPALEGSTVSLLLNFVTVSKVMCDSLLNDTKIIQELRTFDLIVHESSVLCAVIIGNLLSIPRVAISPGPPNEQYVCLHMIPTPVSYVPQSVTGFSDKMTFVQRLLNFGAYVAGRLSVEYVCRSMNALKVKHNIKPEKSFQDGVGDAELLIFLADFALEYPQPLLPGNIMVGPLNVKAPKPLPPDLEEFVNSSGTHGFVIVSFGSYLTSLLANEKVDLLAGALGQLKQKVIWRLKGYIPSDLSANIKALDWLPQNDLLAHQKIRAFVSHVGHNSLYESAYHGVPLVAFPMFSDQFSNAKKAEHFGIGLAVDHKTVSVQQLLETIKQVINNPRFKAKASHISSLMKDRLRSPLQETADWIEHVIRHGGARHLRPHVFNIPWYQYYLLDVMAVLVAMVTVVLLVIILTCGFLCRVCRHRSDNSSKTKED